MNNNEKKCFVFVKYFSVCFASSYYLQKQKESINVSHNPTEVNNIKNYKKAFCNQYFNCFKFSIVTN